MAGLPRRERVMFVELTKEFLGRRAGERIDVAEADARQLLAAGTARAGRSPSCW